MGATPKDDAPALDGDAVATRIRLSVYDTLARSKGLTTVVAQARKHGIGRQHMFDIRAGRSLPSLPLALRMAADLNTTVETLFEHGGRAE